jgi:hypothetical protein
MGSSFKNCVHVVELTPWSEFLLENLVKKVPAIVLCEIFISHEWLIITSVLLLPAVNLCAMNFVAELETARPQTIGEEELQLQLALAMSREEAEQEEQRRRSDDVRLQLALSQSEEEFR